MARTTRRGASTPGRDGAINRARLSSFRTNRWLSRNGAILKISLQQNHGGWNSDDNENHNLGRFRLSVTSATNAVADPVPAEVREIFQTPAGSRSSEQVAAVFSYLAHDGAGIQGSRR